MLWTSVIVLCVSQLEQERGEHRSRHAQMRETMMGLEEEVQVHGRKLDASEEEHSRLRNECSSLRYTRSQKQLDVSIFQC